MSNPQHQQHQNNNTNMDKLSQKYHTIQFVDKGALDPNELLKPMVIADPNIEGKTANELEAELTNHKAGGSGQMDATLRRTEERHPEIDLEADDGDEGGEADL